MSRHFEAFVRNLNRFKLLELIDGEVRRLRMARANASLIVNPLSGEPYPTEPICDTSPSSES